MNRQQYVSICRNCHNRLMNLEKGLLCGLTNDYADFEGHCKDFVEDQDEKLSRNIEELSEVGYEDDAAVEKDSALNKTAGILFFFGGLAFNLVLLYLMEGSGVEVIFFGIPIFGIFLYLKGERQHRIVEKRKRIKEMFASKNDKVEEHNPE